MFSEFITNNDKNQKFIEKRYNLTEEVNHYKSIALSGFEAHEEKIIESLIQVFPKNSEILCIGGGCGREAFAFEKRGFDVTSLDTSKEMTRVGLEIKKQINSKVQFQCGNFLDWQSERKYQVVFLGSVLINFIQGNKNRIKALQKIRSFLKEGGLVIFETDVFENRPFSRFGLSSWILKLRLGKQWEKGDTTRSFFGNHTRNKNLVFYHYYPDKEDIYFELKEACFMGIGDRDSIFWGIKR